MPKHGTSFTIWHGYLTWITHFKPTIAKTLTIKLLEKNCPRATIDLQLIHNYVNGEMYLYLSIGYCNKKVGRERIWALSVKYIQIPLAYNLNKIINAYTLLIMYSAL